MKHPITKTLLCGILASTFFLVNCQKAPERGVRAQSAGAGAAEKAAVQKLSVACSDDFLSKQKISKEAFDALKAKELKNLSDEDKTDLNKKMEELAALTAEAIGEIKKINKDATECKDKEGKEYKINLIQKDNDDLFLLIGKETGIKNKQTEVAEVAEVNKQKRDTRALSVGVEFTISSELAAELKRDNKNGGVYFTTGTISKNGDAMEVLKKDKTATVCEISAIGDDAAFAAEDKLKVMKIEASSLILMKGDQSVSISCSLKKGSEKDLQTEFRYAMGKNMTRVGAVEKQKTEKLPSSAEASDPAVLALDTEIKKAADAGDNVKAARLSDNRAVLIGELQKKAKEEAAKKEEEAKKAAAAKKD